MLLLCNALACCEAQNDSRLAQDCKAAVRIDTGARQWLVWLCFVLVGRVQEIDAHKASGLQTASFKF